MKEKQINTSINTFEALKGNYKDKFAKTFAKIKKPSKKKDKK
jgi:hypothetical protein